MWTLAGVVAGYVVVSPAGMVFFHEAHSGLSHQEMMHMQDSTWESVPAAFDGRLALWWAGFALVGGVFGSLVGLLIAGARRAQRAAEAQARELAEANRQLADAWHKLQQSDRMASLGVLFATVTHDIANCLTVIVSDLPPAPREGDDEWVGSRHATEQIRRLCLATRRFAQGVALPRERVDLNGVLLEALLLTGKPLTLQRIVVVEDLRAAPGTVEGNASELLQVFINLIQNAADAMKQGGQLLVSTTREEVDVCVTVADSGPGIPPQVLPRIFEAFYSTKHAEGGSGLGLAICRRVVEGHGGRISVESEPGRGTTFRVNLPLARAA